MKENKGTLRRGVCLALFLTAAAAPTLPAPHGKALPGDTGRQGDAHAGRQSEIRAAWEARRARLEKNSKDYPGNKLDILLSLLRAAPPAQVAAEYERLAGAAEDYARLPDYEKTLAQAFVVRFIEQGDNAALVKLLSTKPPRHVATLPLELFLAINSPEGVLPLFDGYESAASEQARSALLEMLRRAFGPQHQSSADVSSFILESKEWYRKNRGKIKVNPYYNLYGAPGASRQLFTVNTPPLKKG